jgi:hypothetical protein
MERVRSRLLALAGVLIVFIGAMCVLQWQEGQVATGAGTPALSAIVLGPDDFDYGPQAWRPYAVPLPIDPEADEGTHWYLAFVPLNGTPVGPGAFTGLGDAVAIHYRASSLSGRMAFAVYGTGGDDRSWTNRVTGYGASGYYVTGTELPAESIAGIRTLPTGSPFSVSVSSGVALPEGQATLAFHRNGSGLDSLHLTRTLVERKGQVTRTSAPEGTFYITSTGGGQYESAFLLVAVDRAQPLSFQLTLESRPVEIGGAALA